MPDEREWEGADLREFFDTIGTAGAGAKVFGDGVQFVDDVEYWRWLTDTVVKTPYIDGVRVPLSDAAAIESWVTNRINDGNKGQYLQHLLQNRGAEFDFVRMNQHDPIEFLRGNQWRMSTPFEDRELGIDAVRRNIVTGQEQTHQIKAGLSDSFRRVDVSQYAPDAAKPVDVLDVNEKIYDWRNSERGKELIAKRGDQHPDLRKAFSDERIAAEGERRMEQAASGRAAPQVTFEGVASQIGKGALIGAVVGVGASTLVNYGRYKSGAIDGTTFGNLILEDSARGALIGGSIAAVNIPVQLAAHALGVGNPVTIPVMIVVGAGLRHVIDPIFGRGAYAETLQDLEITRDAASGIARFIHQSQVSYEMQRSFLEECTRLELRTKVLNEFSEYTDRLLDDAIDDL